MDRGVRHHLTDFHSKPESLHAPLNLFAPATLGLNHHFIPVKVLEITLVEPAFFFFFCWQLKISLPLRAGMCPLGQKKCVVAFVFQPAVLIRFQHQA